MTRFLVCLSLLGSLVCCVAAAIGQRERHFGALAVTYGAFEYR